MWDFLIARKIMYNVKVSMRIATQKSFSFFKSHLLGSQVLIDLHHGLTKQGKVFVLKLCDTWPSVTSVVHLWNLKVFPYCALFL